jgi:hypothetical protein
MVLLSAAARRGPEPLQPWAVLPKKVAAAEGWGMSAITIQQMTERVAQLLEERLRVKGSLQDKLHRAGRRLPRKAREAGAVLVQAEAMAQSPKLLLQIDHEAVALAYDICVRHLNTVNPGAARRNMVLNIAASIAFSLLVVGLLVLAVIYLRGLV